MTNYFIIMLYIDFENPKSRSTAGCIIIHPQRLEKYECMSDDFLKKRELQSCDKSVIKRYYERIFNKCSKDIYL